MFAKVFKSKAYNNLKGSSRKTLVQKIQSVYPSLTEDDLKELVPLKAGLASMKLTTSVGDEVTVHIVENVPMMLELLDEFYPTIYAMWKCPNMIPTITIHHTVAGKFKEGPYNVSRGHIFFPPAGVKPPYFRKGQVISVNMTNNKSSVLVGIAGYFSNELFQVQRGQCVKTIQMIGDLLCKFEKFVKVDRPKLEAPYIPKKEDIETAEIVDGVEKISLSPTEESKDDNRVNENNVENEPSLPESVDEPATENSTVDENGYPLEMDGLLRYCLLSVIKTQGKKLAIPIKTNLLYANDMTPFCPANRTLDVKKSSYKKMGKFLEAMQNEGLLQVRPIEKGVDAVVGVDINHLSVKNHIVLKGSGGSVDSGGKKGDEKNFSSPAVKEMYKITAAVLPLFASSTNLKRGDAVTGAVVSSHLVSYVRRNNLQDPKDKNIVRCDPLLAHITPEPNCISWENLKAAIIKKMTNCTEMTFADGSTAINTGKLPMITMQVANRSGNKKVTIVSNLHYYGISLANISKECQHGVAASCSITRSPGSKFDQLMVQGNQQYFLAKHLTEFYKLPKRFIDGAEKALAKKKP